MSPSDYRKVDITARPTRWDVAYGAAICPDGALLVDNQALTVKPGAWPPVPAGFDFLVKSIPFSGTED